MGEVAGKRVLVQTREWVNVGSSELVPYSTRLSESLREAVRLFHLFSAFLSPRRRSISNGMNSNSST
jgi:hypothetical protein